MSGYTGDGEPPWYVSQTLPFLTWETQSLTDCALPPLSGLPVVLRHPSSETDTQPDTLVVVLLKNQPPLTELATHR